MLSALAYTAAYIQILRNNESMPGETTYMEEADVLEAAMFHALHDGVWSDVSNFLLDQAQLYGTIGDLLEESELDKREHRNIVTALDRLMELLPQT